MLFQYLEKIGYEPPYTTTTTSDSQTYSVSNFSTSKNESKEKSEEKSAEFAAVMRD